MNDSPFPNMVPVKQQFTTNPILNISEAVADEFARVSAHRYLKPGQRIAVTAGSRGIANIAEITLAIIEQLKRLDTIPFIVPAMGSHGGATAQGQLSLINHLGISESTMGVPIKSSMNVVSLGSTEDGIPVYIDRNASEADHIIPVNRVKPHTDFHAPNESGIIKMLAIGLGKQKAADRYHNFFIEHGHYPILTSVARVVQEQRPITFGFAIVENQRDETEIIRMISGHQIEEEERQLLQKAKEFLPRLPLQEIDLLVVDYISKTYSGTGMDQNIIGRSVVPYHVVPESPTITRIFVKDLAQDSGGNVLGIGNADVTTARLVEKIDREVTYMNGITSSAQELCRIPPYFDSDYEALEICFRTLPFFDWKKARVVHIKNTLHLEYFSVSEPLVKEIESKQAIHPIEEPAPFSFDTHNNLYDLR